MPVFFWLILERRDGLAIVVLVLLPKVPTVPGRRTDAPLGSQLDLMGAFLTTAGLALLVAPLTEVERLGRPLTAALTALGAAFLVGFWLLERRREATNSPAPMMPPSLWRIRSFTTANIVTFVVYGALSAVMFLLTLALALALFPMAAQAQYKCTINGKTVYADAPCARDARPVGELQDSVSKDQEIQRLKQSLKEQRQRNAIDGRQAADQAALQRATDAQIANEAAQARVAESARSGRAVTE